MWIFLLPIGLLVIGLLLWLNLNRVEKRNRNTNASLEE